MQRSTTNMLKLSALIAIGLWVVATLVEMLLRPEPSPVARSEPVASPDAARHEAASAPIPAACTEVEDNVEVLVDESRACATDDDCTLFDYGYPIDCMTSVAKSAIPGLRTAYRQYDQSCEHRLYFDCPTDPFVRVPVCLKNRCTVELFRAGDPEGRILEREKRE